MIHIGDYAPDFNLTSSTGEKISLSSFKGKNIVLYFYPKNDTPVCTQEARDFNDNVENFSKLNTIIVGISPDNTASHCNFKKKYNLALTLLTEPEDKVFKLYGAWGEKSMFGKKYLGVLRTTFLINKEGIITDIWSNVKVDNHISEILKAVKNLNYIVSQT